jgi:hypothetical protein
MASFVMNENDVESGFFKKGYKVRLTDRLARIQHPVPSDMRRLTEFAEAQQNLPLSTMSFFRLSS